MFTGNVPVWAVYAFIAYFVAFVLLAGGLFLWWAIRRKERPPEKFRLLRGPGETQRRRVQKADEDMFLYFLVSAFAPLFVAGLILAIAARMPKSLIVPAAACALLAFIGVLIICARRLWRFLRRRRDDLLGYLGERAVAEYLDPLRENGFRIFHDVPCEGRKRNFNIDHVAVGPSGVAAIEVKTRRKKKGRPGFEEHIVTYDGQRLIWPWGEDRCGIDQLQSESDWLREFILKRTGLAVHPKPILAFPGWWVTERVVGTFRVTNHKLLPAIIRDWKPQPLTPEQVDLISRQLDERCRDVED
ncbi:MAG: nuclease-related domain-containing protein [Candidatus Udaeobacter sp.]